MDERIVSRPEIPPLPNWAVEISPSAPKREKPQKLPALPDWAREEFPKASDPAALPLPTWAQETTPSEKISEIGPELPAGTRAQKPAPSYVLGQKIAPEPREAPPEDFLIEKPDQPTIERMRMIEKGVPLQPPGLGTTAIKIGKQLAETPIGIIKGGIEATKAAIQKPKEIIPSMREAYDYATSHEGQKEILREGYKSLREFVTFLPTGLINFIKNPQKEITENPLRVIFVISAVGGGAARLVSQKLKAKSVIRPEEIRAAVEEIAPDEIRLEQNLEKIKTLSARRPEEIETWTEAPRARITQPEEMVAGEEIRINRDLDTGEIVIKIPAKPTAKPPEVIPAPKVEVPGERIMRLRKKVTPTYLQEKINYGGEIKTRGEVIKELQDKGIPQKNIDYYMMGAKKIPEIVEPPTPVPTPASEMEGILEYERRFREERRVGPPLSKEELKGITDYERRFGERRKAIEPPVVEPIAPKEIPAPEIKPKADFEIRKRTQELLAEMKVPRQKWGKIYERVIENYKPEEGDLESYIRKTAFGRTPAGTPILTEEGEPFPKPKGMREISFEETKELGAKEKAYKGLEIKGEETRVKNILLRQAKDDIDKDILVGRFFDHESYEALGRRHGISRQAIEKRINEGFRKLKADPEAEVVKDYLKQKEYLEVNAGIPMTSEISKAVKSIRDRIREKRVVRLDEIKTELQKTPEGKVEWMYLETDRLFKEKRDPTIRKAIEGAKRAFVDTSGNIKRKLLKELGDRGKEAVIDHDLIAGANAKTERLFSEASDKIYKGLSSEQEALLNKAIQSRRTVAISKYKPEMKHPLGLTAKEHEAYLKTIPKEIIERADLYFKETEKRLDELKSEGLLSDESYKELKSKGDYSPRWFINHLDPETTSVIGGRKITVPDSGIKSLDEGSFKVMETNSRTLLSNVIGRTQARIFRNRANKSLWNIAKEFPENEIVKEAPVVKATKEGKPIYQPAPGGYTKIKAMIEGEVKEMLMPDKYAKEWVTRDPLINEQLANIIGWMSGSKILKPMATGLNPEFALTNMPRDIAHVWLTTPEYSSFLPKTAAQFARDFFVTAKDTFKRIGRWTDYIDEGGGMSFLTHQGRALPKAGILGGFQKVMGWVGETSEIWTRLALRERALRNGKSPKEATWIARNYLDFSQGGNVAKAIDSGIPYFNAAIQGTRGIFRALGDRPVDTLWKFAELGALATGVYLANRYVNKNAWDSVSNRDKVNNFIITTPFNYKDNQGNKRYLYFKVAKDQGQRVITSVFENLMAKSLGEEVDADQITQSIQEFLPIVPTDMLPPSIEAFLGHVVNKDFWTRRDIWKGPRVAAREKYTKYTHPALVEAGKITGLSPEKLGFSLSQFFTRGNVFTSLVSGGFSLAFRDLDKPTQEKMMQETLTNLPFIRRVLKSTPPYSEKELKEEEKIKTEESTRRYKQRREYDEILDRYYKTKKEERTAPKEIFSEIKSFIKEQPKEDRDRLVKRFTNYGLVYDIPDRSWWLGLSDATPEARATIFWTKYTRSDESEKKEMIRLAKKIPGIYSDRFISKLRLLIREAKLEPEK